MKEEEIKQALDTLSEFQAQIDSANLSKQELIDSVLTPEIKARISEIEAEFAGKNQSAQDKVESLTKEIEQAILEHGSTVKGTFKMALYCNGRVTWDTKGLDKAIELIPALSQYRKIGNPYVTIKKV